jgi:ubiquinone/menaquinone biosynthesis C-methylase UbiE
MLTHDAKAVAHLEKLYSSPQLVDQRRRLRAIVAARPGESGLDAGCGVAYLACELAREVAPGGRIAAIDNSGAAVEASMQRVAKEGLEGSIDVRHGDAADLPFADATFDFAVAAQVYCYVPDVARAIREAARVLQKGGRLVVLDSDWDMCFWASADPALTRRIIAARGATQFAHAYLPRELHALMRAAGLTLADAQAFSIVETRHDPDSFSMGIIPSMRDAALKQGIAPEEVARWVEELQSRTAEGEWFFCLNRFVFTATKAPATQSS